MGKSMEMEWQSAKKELTFMIKNVLSYINSFC